MKRSELVQFFRKNKKFLLLWITQILSLVTVNMVNFMMMTKIYNRTGSSLAVSFLWVFYYIPAFFLGPFSGLFVDRWSKRKVLFFTNILQSLTVLLFLLIGERIFPVYPFVFFYSLIDEFYVPAQAASLPWLVEKKDLPVANSLFFMTSQGSLIIGFGLSGILMGLLGQNNIIVLASLFLFLAAVSSYFLPRDNPDKKKIDNLYRFWVELKAGYQYIAASRVVLFPMILAICFSIILTIFGVSLPALASQVFRIAVKDAGPLIIVPVGLGALTAISMISKLSKKYRKKELIKMGLIFSISVFVVFSLFLHLLGRFTLPLGICLSFILGFGGLLILVPNQTLLQENIPPKLRGRVFGTLGFVTTVLMLPFLLFSATMIDALGIRPFLFFAGGIVLIFLIFLNKAEDVLVAEKNGVLNGNK